MSEKTFEKQMAGMKVRSGAVTQLEPIRLNAGYAMASTENAGESTEIFLAIENSTMRNSMHDVHSAEPYAVYRMRRKDIAAMQSSEAVIKEVEQCAKGVLAFHGY
jgi:hypothetical protein